MGVYKTQSGKWAYSIQRNGVRERVTVGTRKEAEQAYEKARYDLTPEKCDTNLHDWMKIILKRSATKVSKNTILSYRNSLLKISSELDNIPLNRLTRQDIEAYIECRTRDVSPATVNRELMFLSKCYRVAILEGKVYSNPCRGMMLAEDHGRVRFLDEAEIARLLAVCEEPLKGIVELAIYSGLRKDEIFSLKWEDVGPQKVSVRRKWKGSNRQAVRLSRTAQEAINRQPRVSAYVFQNERGGRRRSCRTAFSTAVRKAGLGPDVSFHTLRHTFASHAVMGGMSLRALQEILGHTKLDMVTRYAHLAHDFVDTILDQVTERLSKGVNESSHVDGSEKS